MTAAEWAARLGPQFSLEALRKLEELDPQGQAGIIRRLLELYAQTLTGQVRALEGAVQREDLQAVRAAVHAARSSSLSVGAQSFADRCRDLEHRIRECLSVEPVESAESAVVEPVGQDLLREAHSLTVQAGLVVTQVQQALQGGSA